MTVGRLGEREILRRIVRGFGELTHGGPLLEGPGDDAALLGLPAGRHLAMTSDLLLEEVHFRRSWAPPALLGRKALAVNLSDLAAMGASPEVFLLDLGLPPDWPVADLDAFIAGMSSLARETGIRLAGGDTCSSRLLHIGITATGSVKAGMALLRRTVEPGDTLAVSGALGAAHAGLRLLQSGWRLGPGGAPQPPAGGAALDDGDVRQVLQAHLAPQPELACGVALRGVARAAMDLSDGLSQDLRRLCAASGCGAIIDAGRVPVDAAARRVLEALGEDPLEAALSGGEDYRLLVALPPGRPVPVALLPVGESCAAAAIQLDRGSGPEPWPEAGFRHFSSP